MAKECNVLFFPSSLKLRGCVCGSVLSQSQPEKAIKAIRFGELKIETHISYALCTDFFHGGLGTAIQIYLGGFSFSGSVPPERRRAHHPIRES